MRCFKPIAFVTCLGALGLVFLSSSKADQWDKKTILTVSEPIQVAGTVLQPGKYVFKLADSPSDRHIVQIFNADETQIQSTILAIPNYRLQPTGDSRFSFWEMPAGQPSAMRAWFYPGDNFGQEFLYPKEMAATISGYSHEPVPSAEPENPSAPAAPVNPEPRAQAAPPEPPAPSENQLMAESTPPPAPESATPPAAESQSPPPVHENTASQSSMGQTGMSPSSTQPETENKQLPSTASPYPLVALIGLLSMGAAAAARLVQKRVS